MTDQELLQLLDDKMPEELSLEEIEILRQRLAESPALREALAGQVHFESYLQSALARLKLSPAEIAAKARAQQANRGGLSLLALILMIVVPAIGVLGIVAFNILSQPEVAQRDNEEKEDEKKEETPEVAPPVEPEPGANPGAIKPTETVPNNPTKAPKPMGPVPPPWQAVAESQVEPPAFQQIAYQTFDLTKEVVRREALQQWFESAPGQNHRLHEVDTQYGRCGALEGIARLKSPWLNDSLLRMWLENYNKLQIHFFHKNVGVTLVYHQDNMNCWAAYTTTRKPKGARPETLAITATDDTRNFRTEIRHGGPLDLRYEGGQVVLSRGDIVLVSAPLPGPPDDVYFEGRATFYGLQFLRAKDPPQSEPQRKIVFETDRPADLPWKTSPAEAQKQVPQPIKNDDGSLSFKADNAEKYSWCWTPLPQQGLQQVVFQLKNVTPGVAVYLGRDQGHPDECIRFFKNRRNGRLIARLRGVDNDHELDNGIHTEAVEPCVSPENCWVRLQFGCATFRCWLSSDGRNWAQVDYMREALRPKIDSLGLFLVGKRPKSEVTLARLEIRELSGLTNLAKAEMKDQALSLPSATFAEWQQAIAKGKPPEIDPDDWRRACAIKTLGAGATKELSHPLLEMLLDDPSFRQKPVEEQLHAHADAFAIVSDLKDGQSMRVGLEKRLANVGLQAFQDRDLPPWSTIRRTYISTPVFTVNRNYNSPLLALETLIRTELLQRAYAQQPRELLDLCEQLRFYHLDDAFPIIVWAEAHARRETASRSPGGPVVVKESWRPLLVEEVSKETYNLTSELQSVLDSEAWEDAARLITSVDPEAAPGVSPYVKDRQLLTSLPVAVQLLLKDYPQLKEALGDRYGPLAKLRIGQAVAAADAAAVELATVQFGATSESAEASRWLGDRALSNGWFEEALAHYQQAIARHSLLAGELAPRIRLAAAMLGRNEGSPATSDVQFNNLKLDPQQFEALVSEMRGRGTSAAVSPALHIMPGSPLAVPQPTAFASHNRSRLDGAVGDKPQEEVGRKTNQNAVAWPDMQLSATVEKDTLYVTNRFQLAAYNLMDGQRMWQSRPPPGTMQKAQDFALIAMRPLVLRDQILARQLYGKHPQIACWNKANGELLWSTERGDREFFVSDPVYLHGQIVALSIALLENQEGQLRWNVLDPATGELQVQRDLIRLRNTWGSRACCEVLPLDHRLVVALGGITLGLDARGQVAWVRKQVTLPSDEDPRWVLQTFQRPIVHNGQLILAQPGTRSVICLDPATGFEKWETLLPDVLGCWGVSQGNVVLRTEAGVQSLDAATGKRKWFTPLTDMQPHGLVDEKSILCVRKIPQEGKKEWTLQLLWLDPATGSERATTRLAALQDLSPRLGVMVPYKDRLFTFFGRGQHDPNRDVVELIPSGTP